MQRQLINRGKEAVYVQDHVQLKQLYAETHNGDYQLSVADIFLQLFYYACQHNRKNTIVFLFQMYYEIFSEAERIGLRQGFYYGKFKIKKKSLVNWYNQCILPVIKVN
jgi:hypothetical protein